MISGTIEHPPMALTAYTRVDEDLVGELLTMCKLHSKTISEEDARLLRLYTAGAIASAENYIDRDIAPTHREYQGYPECATWRGQRCNRWEFARGRANTLTVYVSDGNGGWTAADASTYTLLNRSVDPKARGFTLIAPSSTQMKVAVDTGFAEMALLPPDIMAFMLAAFDALHSVRGLANYQATIQMANFYPTYMLEPWAGVVCE